MTDVPIAAMASTVGLAITSQILDAIPQVSAIHPWLPTHYWLAFGDLLREPVDLSVMGRGLACSWPTSSCSVPRPGRGSPPATCCPDPSRTGSVSRRRRGRPGPRRAGPRAAGCAAPAGPAGAGLRSRPRARRASRAWAYVPASTGTARTVRARTSEDLIQMVESAASSELYSLLKRPDEKAVTERAYERPVFVEDLVRNIAAMANEDSRIEWYRVEAENYESIHNHNAYAMIENG